MNPLLQGHSGITLETSRNVFSVNQGTNEDDSQSNTHPERACSPSGQEDHQDMVMGVQRGSIQATDMVTGVIEQIRSQRDILTGSHEEVMYCSPSTSSERIKRTAL